MVKFNELRITEDNKFIIDVSVLSLLYYENLQIKTIYIGNQDTYKDGGPSKESVAIPIERGKGVRLTMDYNDPRFLNLKDGSRKIDILKDLLFVYVETSGEFPESTPADLQVRTTLEVTINSCPIYNSIMQQIKELLNECEIPKHFLDRYLRFKAIEISVASKHYMQAIAFYNKFYKRDILKIAKVKCKCNG